MPPLKNKKHEIFATALVFGNEAGIRSLAAAHIAAFGGNPKGARQSGFRIAERPEVAERIAELRAEMAAGFKMAGYSLKEARQTLYNFMIDKILATIAERSQDPMMAGIPGASEGLLVKKSRTFLTRIDPDQKAAVEAAMADEDDGIDTRHGDHKYSPFHIVEEVKADTALLEQLLKYLNQAAAEDRDYKTHSDITSDGQSISISDDERIARITAILERARQAGVGQASDDAG